MIPDVCQGSFSVQLNNCNLEKFFRYRKNGELHGRDIADVTERQYGPATQSLCSIKVSSIKSNDLNQLIF